MTQTGLEDTPMAEKRPGEPFTRIDVQEAKKMIDEEDVQVIDSREVTLVTTSISAC